MVTIDEGHSSEGESRSPRRSARASAPVTSHRDLVAWKKAYALGLELYAATQSFPPSEAFGLTGQLRRAGISVSSNIAEGRGRDSKRDFIRFLNVANGSLAEIDTQLRFAADLEYLPTGRAGLLLQQVDECGCLINALRSALRRSLASERKPRRLRTPQAAPGPDIVASARRAERPREASSGVPDS